jgi:hypothetical protein
LYIVHAEYPAVSVSRKLHSRTPPQINAIAASREGSQSEVLFTRTFKIDKGWQLLCVADNARAVVIRHISNLASKNNTLLYM